MFGASTDWRTFWSTKQTPLHTHEDEGSLRDLAQELRLAAEAPAGHATVCEIGCGNGVLYRHLGFHQSDRYVGVDFSDQMLADFRQREPGVDVRLAEGSQFQCDERFDLILSSHVSQYWSAAQLADHLRIARTMLADDGLIVVGGSPWRRMRWAFARGDVAGGRETGRHRRSLPRSVLEYGREIIQPDIGSWFEFEDFARIAKLHHLDVTFRGSNFYPYRFHTTLRASG